jgi:hypothetical protein
MLVFTPASAVTSIFLMTPDNVGPALAPLEGGAHTLSKSDRLVATKTVSIASTDTGAFVQVVRTTRERPPIVHAASADVEPPVPMLIRGRLEEELGAAITQPAVSEESIPSRPNQRRRMARLKPPLKLVADVVLPETQLPSLLERLFGLRSL